MTDYDANNHTPALLASKHGQGTITRLDRLALFRFPPGKKTLNRGTNTGAGAAYVYWLSPRGVDTTGIYYNQSVPWAQISSIIDVGSIYITAPW